jgi:endonuclease YncB( thermonuclease family)
MSELVQQLKEIKNHEIELFTLKDIRTLGKVVDIYDGDTCKIVLLLDNRLQKMNCRLMGLDTPEMKPSLQKTDREEEILNAYRCRNRLISLVTDCECPIDNHWNKKECIGKVDTNQKIIHVECLDFDKYGRLLVRLWENDSSEKSVNEILIEEHYAKEYDGGKKDVFHYA